MRSHYRFAVEKSIMKRPVSYDEEARVVIDSGADPVWRYDVTSATFV